MAKQVLTHLSVKRISYWLVILFISVNLVSFTTTKSNTIKPDHRPVTLLPVRHTRLHSFDNDPIRFTMRTDKQRVSLNEEVTLTITAHYLAINPTLLFITDAASAFRLKLLLPEGFVQTGGDYTDYIGTKLSASTPTATYTLKGYFVKAVNPTSFRLLRGQANADANSLFVEKAQVSVQVNEAVSNQHKAKGARMAVSNGVGYIDFVDCNTATGWVADWTQLNTPIAVDFYIDGQYAGSATGDQYRGDVGAALGDNGYHGYSFSIPQQFRSGGNHTIEGRYSGTSQGITNGVKTYSCSGGSSNPSAPSSNPSSGGNSSLTFQIVSYDCNSGALQYQFTSGDGSPVNVTLPGVFGGTMSPNAIASYTFPGDARQGRTVTGTASQSGNQININFTTSCNLTSSQPTSNPAAKETCILETDCITYQIDCKTNQIINAIYHECRTIQTGGGTGDNPTTGNPGGNPSSGNPGTGSGNPSSGTNPSLTGTRVPTTAYMDGIDCDKISGWAFANSGGYAYLDIYIVNGFGQLSKAATIKSNNVTRSDVRSAYGNNPNIPLDCGFLWAIPDAYKTGHPISVKVVPVNDVSPIGNSPLTSSGDCNKPSTNPGGTTGNPNIPILTTNRFFYAEMEAIGITFTDEEKVVINEFPELISDIREYININGFKPDLGANLNGWFYDENNNQSGKISLKVVGVDSYNEDTDYRLYKKECEAYEYLFDKAVSASAEYGAYITAKGIIVLPNNQSYTGPDGYRHVKFRRWRINKDSNNLIVPADKGIFPVLGFLHTHPGGGTSPSQPDDTDFARGNPKQKHYIITTFLITEFFSDGSTKPYAGVFEKRCP